MFTLADPTYTIRSPKNKEEWDVVKQLLLDYKLEFNDDTCFTSFEQELANIEEYYHQLGFSIIAPYNHQDPLKLICFEKDLTTT